MEINDASSKALTCLNSLNSSTKRLHNYTLSPFIHEGKSYNYLYYTYTFCEGFPVQVIFPERNFVQCVCRSHVAYSVACVILAVIGVIVNSIVIWIYRRNKSKQKRNSTLLIVNQAVVDIVNCIFVMFSSLSNITLYFLRYPLGYPYFYSYYANGSLWHLSATSSILTFTLIASERCVAIMFPLWHRVYVTTFWIKACVILIWLISVSTSASTFVFVSRQMAETYRQFTTVEAHVFTTLMILITCVFGISFLRALMALQKRSSNSRRNLANGNFEKQRIRLVAIFIVMYVIFLPPFIPRVISAYDLKSYFKSKTNIFTSSLSVLLSCLASICDPLLVIITKEGFQLSTLCKKNRIDGEMALQKLDDGMMYWEIDFILLKTMFYKN